MSTIRTLIDGKKYQLICSYYDENNKRRQRTKVVCCGIREARKQMEAFIVECEAKPLDDSCTVEQLLAAYIEQAETKGARKTTLYGYEYCRKRIVAYCGNVPAKDLTPFRLDKFVTYLVKEKKYSPKTVHDTIFLLNAAYNYAIREKLLHYNPCPDVTLPKAVKYKPVVLKEDQVKGFLEDLKKESRDFRVFCYIALFCGLRLSEILGLTENDIDMKSGVLRVEKARHRLNPNDGDYVDDTKTEQSRRVMTLPSFVLDEIKLLIEEHKPYGCEYLIQYVGEPMKPSMAENRMRQFRKKHDLDRITPHGLRHSFATMLNASKEFDIAEISAALGHSNISTTLNIYTHIFQEESHSSRRIADSFQRIYSDEENQEESENCCTDVAK